MRRPLRLLVCLLLPLLAAPSLLAAPPSAPSDITVAQLVERDDRDGLRALGPAALPVLARLYEQGDEARRVKIAGIFYQLGMRSRDAERALLRDARTQNPQLRVGVQYALGRVSDDARVVETLLDVLRNDKNPLFKDKAGCALAYDQIHLTEAQKVRVYEGLIAALSDSDPMVQGIAIQALSVLTGQNKGFYGLASAEKKRQSIEVWKKWLAEYRANL